MSDDELKSFKIGQSHSQGLSKPRKKGGITKEEQSQAASLGFNRIEELLENEDPVQVGESLNSILAALEEKQNSAASNKDKAACSKAITAVERTVDLIDFLYQTKAELEDGGTPA